eukprot:scaffold8649_cov185-Amphora_coffeaeformis.AAC.10
MIRRLRCQPNLDKLMEIVGNVELTFKDAEGDCIAIMSDECLEDAIRHSKTTKGESVKLTVRQSSTIGSLWSSVSKISRSSLLPEKYSTLRREIDDVVNQRPCMCVSVDGTLLGHFRVSCCQTKPRKLVTPASRKNREAKIITAGIVEVSTDFVRYEEEYHSDFFVNKI